MDGVEGLIHKRVFMIGELWSNNDSLMRQSIVFYSSSPNRLCFLFFVGFLYKANFFTPSAISSGRRLLSETLSRPLSVQMFPHLFLPRSELYSVWERKHAFQRGFPFSDPNRKYWCFKRRCDYIFSSLGRVAQHEKFAHSRHPLTGDYGDWLERMEGEEEVEAVPMILVPRECEEVTRQNIVRIGMDFFEKVVK
ncbi:uncharacterized protein LY89DRAFT_282038 [Mollisia scopiformis]|uniref:C2H2-type domain-containing protein n=1 Tax=Mollisia scopiformis TaxID=149040 RepID=A0A132BA41_MOLSC|nr:uncharacterized protein LY89DRAFT_282038 [Mollisia scopiformis]KUJ09268.1 hypothetical protein LY89DRAFT_282038 [Mollisia scopiformis]